MSYEISKLPNGVRVVSAPLKERKSVAIGIWVHVGGRDEEARINGVSHFLEHLVFKGTEKRNANQIKESVEGIGGSLNAFTSEEYTCFLAKASHKHFDQVFDVLADMVLNATLKEEDIRKERTVIMEEIKMTQDQPAQLVEEHLAEILWPGHALGWPLAGSLESVGGMREQDIRGYRDKFYEPNLITIAASGAITHKKILSVTRSHFSASHSKNHKKLELFKKNQSKSRMKLFSKPTEQTHISLGLHSFAKNHSDEIVLDILSVILGGNMSSRLFNEVREERGLAYEISSAERKYHETGSFEVSAGVDNRKVVEAIKVIMSELSKTAQKLVGGDELKRAKEFYIGQLELGLENSMNHMLWLGESLVCLGRCKTPQEVIKKVQRVTPEDLKRVARQLFQTNALNLAVVGPKVSELENEIDKSLRFS